MKNMNSILKESVISLNDYFDTNQVDDFFQLVDQVIEQLQLEEAHEQVIHFTLCKASLYFNVSHLTLASQVLAENATYIEKYGDVAQKIRYLNTLAAIQGRNDDLEQAFMYLDRAKQLAEQYDRTHLVKIYHNLSVYYFNQQQFDESLLYAQKSMAYFAATRKAGTQNNRALMNYAKILIAMERLEEADELLEIVKAQLQEDDGESRLAWVKTYVEWLGKKQQFDKAYAVLKQEIAQHPNKHSWNKELYELLCPLSKKTQSKRHYFQDLKQLKQAMDLVNADFVTTQLQSVKKYVDIEQLQKIAWCDPLTNVHNRKYLEEHYEAFSLRYQQHTVLVFDIDHFKEINDTFGHISGDQAIQQMADAVNYFFEQQKAMFVRYGGDEFYVYYQGPSEADVVAFAHYFHETLIADSFTYEHMTLPLSVSMGSVYAAETHTYTEWFEAADSVLYEVKRQKRGELYYKTV